MSNRRYVSDQSEVIDGYAKLTRSGLSQAEVQRAMNDAVDLAAIKNISLSDAVALLDNAEHGRMRGLIDLGITTSKYTDAQGNLILANHSVAKAMDELDVKLKGGKLTLTDVQQASNDLAITWQQFASKSGAGTQMTTALADALSIGSLLLQLIMDMGHNNSAWNAVQDRLIEFGHWVQQNVTNPLQDAYNSLYSLENQGQAAPALREPIRFAPGTAPISGKAAGGPVLPGHIYTVGESGPETLVMGGDGGTVIPNTGSGNATHYHLTLNGSAAVNDPEAVRRMLQRMQLLGAAG